MFRYGTYIFGGDYSLYVVVDDGARLVLIPTVWNAKCVFRVIGVEISSWDSYSFSYSHSNQI